MERYIAVDNVCSWPNLTLLPDGVVLATIFNQPCHGLWEGDVECWVSSDGGRTWMRRSVPAPHDSGTIRMNVAAGLTRNGDLLILASGWGGEKFRGHLLPVRVCRSSDHGGTWAHGETFYSPNKKSHLIPYGKVMQLADGTLGVNAYSHLKVEKQSSASPSLLVSAFFVRSLDDGRTWNEASLLSENVTETDGLVLSDGTLLAAGRISREHALVTFRSVDHGRSWTRENQITGPAECPAHLLELADGRILLSHGIRKRGLYGVGARLSDDGGRNWYAPGLVVNLEDSWDGGYPSSVELADGTLVTAFYSSGIPVHNRYHTGVIRWKPDEVFSKNKPPEAMKRKM